MPPRRRGGSPLVPKPLGAGAVVFLVAMLSALVLGSLWGWFQPTGEVAFAATRQVEPVPGSEGNSFAAFGWLVVVCALLGLGTAVIALRMGEGPSLGMLMWAAVSATASGMVCGTIGHMIVTARYGRVPDLHGNSETVVHVVDPIAAGSWWLIAPAIALGGYWLVALVLAPVAGERRGR
ncbi:hypothetical protein [Corynebacterium heidelbergense]|uniref:DUF2567 domain-containing protein n=1 Tax=Corynebacterium heidelbergense TaxID=2055947 RepID=A0A364VB78_9CORY|nr:hypothetical protein [Corynebacterium heidelbergense]RAV33858.1 hypothetical protein CWC39_06210 [Corynebacterium heidelbergense]WCZ36401.1 hypothetical protein CHEID_04250 [Corynebacterium heidelbergense]